ncbi:hypothetical protein [Companilactobacillus nantensis]|uniref:Uncharacterized protein n=1 Tax=Companilactobacillus nantensis DSM 16982 TaxID=1423774 RepID=A0A0R1WM03_9LACO|nr:hypothetical protein [Companilactobacillus nantensis]KRM17252.1 hypothetical protein FD31_GL000331 [Companilactobacillus nantensis DSM 16982]GEO64021.1 hypothetical protein LNA01_12040 [Companilactobacillus nantensis]
MKIAIQLDADRNIIGTVTTSEFGAELQVKLFKDKGWTLVESDPAFSSSDSYLWTVRESDNELVHISTNMTPDEESQNNFTTLTMQNLNLTKDVKETQSGITALTQTQLQDAQDKADIKNGMTEITKQLASMQLQLATQNTNTTEAK